MPQYFTTAGGTVPPQTATPAKTLSDTLHELGFAPVLNSPLSPIPIGDHFIRDNIVGYGKPNTYNADNGILCVWDQNGIPWIHEIRIPPGDSVFDSPFNPRFVEDKLPSFRLTRGGKVPHADNRTFVTLLMVRPSRKGTRVHRPSSTPVAV